ncbi:Hsp20 family protein [Simiduia litorea]
MHASFDNGVLKVSAPKKPAPDRSSQRIAIKKSALGRV